MKVILKQDVKGSGKKGEVIEVADGYARNFLIKRNLATEVSAQSINELKNKQCSDQFKIDQEVKAANEIAEKLNDKTANFKVKAGANGKLFGSVSSKEIVEKIQSEYDVKIDKKKISLDTEVKAFGTYKATIKLYQGITATMNIVVTEE